MTYHVNHPHAVSSVHPAPVLLAEAVQNYLQELTAPQREQAQKLLRSLEHYLGLNAPLLAYTKLTGEAWRRTLPGQEQAKAGALLSEFRAYLRDHGWLDAARPVNLLD